MLELTLRLVFSLAVVVGLLLVLAKVSSKRLGTRHSAALQVLHRQSLSRSAGVSLVTVGERVLLLGVTEQQVSLLAELDPSELPEVEAAEPDALDPADRPADRPADIVLAGEAKQPGRRRAVPASRVTPGVDGGIGGSVLSPQTWRQAYAAATRRAS